MRTIRESNPNAMNLTYTDVHAKLLKDQTSIYMLQITHFSPGIYNYIPLIPHD